MENFAKIEKLNEQSDWSTWKFQVKIALLAQRVYSVVTGEESCPDEEGKKLAWEQKDFMAQQIISLTIGKKNITHVCNCRTSKEMWDKLHVIFEKTSPCSVVMLYEKFFSYSKKPNVNVTTFISEIEELNAQLRNAGEILSPNLLMTKIIRALPPEYSSFRSAWESTEKSERTLENLRARLVIEEDRLENSQEVEIAEALAARNYKVEKGKSVSHKKAMKNVSKVTKFPCYSCGQKGHWKKDCPQNKSQAFNCFNGNWESKECWILDSGASYHMTGNKHWFSEIQSVSREVKIAKGTLQCKGVGKIYIEYFNGKLWRNGVLTDVWYVPELEGNLFSQNHALDQGLRLEATDLYAKFKNKCNETVIIGERKGNMTIMCIRKHENMVSNVARECDPLQKWHERLAHQNDSYVKAWLKKNAIDFVDKPYTCEKCIFGKMHRSSAYLRKEVSQECGELVHMDICGPLQETSLGGAKYFLLIKDDYSHYKYVYFLKEKSEVYKNVKAFIEIARNQFNVKVKAIRSDNGTEFVNHNMRKMLKDFGIRHERTAPYSPEQNGSVERDNRTVMEAARTMLQCENVSNKLWAEAVNTTVYVINRTGTSTIQGKTPYELWWNKKVDTVNFYSFGTEVYAHIPKEKRSKLDRKAQKYIFVGYTESTKNFRVWNSQNNKVQIVRDVIFVDNKETNTVTSEEDNHVVIKLKDNTKEPGKEDSQEKVILKHDMNLLKNNEIIQDRLRRKEQDCNDSNIYALMSIVMNEPRSLQDAIQSTEAEEWKNAMREEIDALHRNGTWDLVNKPSDKNIIDNKWVFKIKHKSDGNVERYKARLVARGFSQTKGVDYNEVFSPVAKFPSLRFILSWAAKESFIIRQFDVKTAFLHGDLKEEIYMVQPEGYDDGTEKVCKLKKSIYGLKQASRCWNEKFVECLRSMSFKQSTADKCIFANEDRTMMICLYVDDGLVIGKKEDDVQKFLEQLRTIFEIKFHQADMFLGIEIKQEADGSILLRSSNYIQKILLKFNMLECKVVSTPISNQVDHSSSDSADVEFPYKEAVGSLLYLSITTRPDISYAVGIVSRYTDKPLKGHVEMVKRIFRYLKGTTNYGLKYGKLDEEVLRVYSDADYAGDMLTRRSTSGYLISLGSSCICWGSERQRLVALSTTESEYIAATIAVKEMLWIQQLIMDITGKNIYTMVCMDNQSAIRLIKNPEFHKRTKHIDVRYHFIREKYEDQLFDLEFVSTDEQVADIFTKGLLRGRFELLRSLIMIK